MAFTNHFRSSKSEQKKLIAPIAQPIGIGGNAFVGKKFKCKPAVLRQSTSSQMLTRAFPWHSSRRINCRQTHGLSRGRVKPFIAWRWSRDEFLLTRGFHRAWSAPSICAASPHINFFLSFFEGNKFFLVCFTAAHGVPLHHAIQAAYNLGLVYFHLKT